MTDVRDTDIKAFYNRLKQRTNSRTGKPLTRWLGYTHQVLRCALREAGDAIPGKNPMQDVKAPKPLREPFDPDAAENQHALSQEQVGRFLDAVAGTRHATLFNLWFATGLRPGEIFGLRWRDVRKDSASITLSTAVEVTKAHGARLKTTLKTPKSHRTIPLPPAVSEMLRAHRTQQNVARLQVGGEWRDMDLVFSNELGGILDGGNLTDRHFRPALERAGLSPAEAKCYSLYDIRHTHATLLLQTGESIVTVSRRLGHATVTLTLNTYAHCLEEHQQAATNRITGMFWAGAG
jgi:integrase